MIGGDGYGVGRVGHTDVVQCVSCAGDGCGGGKFINFVPLGSPVPYVPLDYLVFLKNEI